MNKLFILTVAIAASYILLSAYPILSKENCGWGDTIVGGASATTGWVTNVKGKVFSGGSSYSQSALHLIQFIPGMSYSENAIKITEFIPNNSYANTAIHLTSYIPGVTISNNK